MFLLKQTQYYSTVECCKSGLVCSSNLDPNRWRIHSNTVNSVSYIIGYVPETSLLHHTNVLDVAQFSLSNIFSPLLEFLTVNKSYNTIAGLSIYILSTCCARRHTSAVSSCF